MNGDDGTPDYNAILRELETTDPERAAAMKAVLIRKGLYASDTQLAARKSYREGTLGAEQAAKNQAETAPEVHEPGLDEQARGHGLGGAIASTLSTLGNIPGAEYAQSVARAGVRGDRSLPWKEQRQQALNELRASRGALPTPVRVGAQLGADALSMAAVPTGGLGAVARGAVQGGTLGGLSGLLQADDVSGADRLASGAAGAVFGGAAGAVGGKVGDVAANRLAALRAARAPSPLALTKSNPFALDTPAYKGGQMLSAPPTTESAQALNALRGETYNTPGEANQALQRFLAGSRNPVPGSAAPSNDFSPMVGRALGSHFGPLGMMAGETLGKAFGQPARHAVDTAARDEIADLWSLQAGKVLGPLARRALPRAGAVGGSSSLRQAFGY